MNVYLFELKRLAHSFIVWAVSIVFVVIFLIKGVYPLVMDAEAEFTAMLAGFPPEFLIAFGVGTDPSAMFSYEGFYNMTYTYVGLVMAIMATSFALQIFSSEKRAKCTDFLLTKPVSRNTVFISKLLACLTAIVAVNIVYIAVIAPDFIAKTDDFQLTSEFVLLMLAPFFTQLVFFALGTAYAIFMKRVRSVSGIATAFGFGAFLLSTVVALLEKEVLEVIAPLEYFKPDYVTQHGTYPLNLTIAAIVIIVISFVASYVKYCRSDIAVS